MKRNGRTNGRTSERMTKQLEAFVETHAEGWNHDEWLGLLAELGETGHDVSEPDAIGAALERARVAFELRRQGVTGLGLKRTGALADHFGNLWRLRQASVDDVAAVSTMNRGLAEKVVHALH